MIFSTLVTKYAFEIIYLCRHYLEAIKYKLLFLIVRATLMNSECIHSTEPQDLLLGYFSMNYFFSSPSYKRSLGDFYLSQLALFPLFSFTTSLLVLKAR